MGQCTGALLFPAKQFDEQAVFTEITTALAQLEHIVGYLNDLFSFYKEFDDMHDQATLVNNYSHVEGISLSQALDKVTRDVIHCCERLAVFEGKDANVKATVEASVQGYVTFHLCDDRYRMNEVYERCGDGPVAVKFRHYYEEAVRVGSIDPGEWAIPPVSAIVEKAKKRPSLWDRPPPVGQLLSVRL